MSNKTSSPRVRRPSILRRVPAVSRIVPSVWRAALVPSKTVIRRNFSGMKRLPVLLVLGLLLVVPGDAQQSAAQVSGVVADASGAPVADAQIVGGSGNLLATTGADGTFTVPAGSGIVTVQASRFAPLTVTVGSDTSLHVVLQHPLENVTVTAYRSPLSSMDSPASTRMVDANALRQSASVGLDGKLRQVPGFELFRRSSSLVANPTSEGVSLRGLGSTSASRSLVVFDQVPINDPYGGWIHWEELPALSIQSVEVVRGGASDLYGSSAIGGVISIEPVPPKKSMLILSTSGGSESTVDSEGLGSMTLGKWSGSASGGVVATDGYILIAPPYRGPIDQPSDVHAQNVLVQVNRDLGDDQRVFLRGNNLSEFRHNGTPYTINRTHLWRYAGGADLNSFVIRLYGTAEHYFQTFSSVNAARTAETPIRTAEDPADELGAAGHWHRAFGAHVLVLAGSDIHDVRAADYEVNFSGKGSLINTAARQRTTGVYGEVLYTPKNWTFSGSARVDHFSNFDVNVFTSAPSATGTTQLPSFSETPFNPRLGITRRLTQSVALSASGFRAFRSPTEDELYRTSTVGAQTTLPNPNLRSERATGWETGIETDLHRYGSTVRASYFDTQINRPITALTLSTTATTETLIRENLGQIESRGVSLDFASQPTRWVAVIGGYQYAHATVTKFQPDPALVGKWIPEVARNMATAQVVFTQRRLGLLSVQGRMSGHEFDDSQNQYYITSYFRLDAYASHEFRHNLTFFASGENLFDRAIEVGKTPLPTLGTPRVARGGLTIRFGE
jgi:outer membrane receptor protein involved in Fe transport